MTIHSLSLPNRKPLAGHQRGISLLEMMVAVSIVLVMGLILTPFSQDLLRRGQTTKCASHLRQIAAAGLSYAADNKGRLPDMSRWYSSSRHDAYSLFYYLNLPVSGDSINQDSIFTCPVFVREFPTAISPHRTYSINRYAVGSVVNSTVEWEKILGGEPPQNLQKVAQPSRMAFFMDGKVNNLTPSDNHSYRSYMATDGISPAEMPHLHQSGLNVAFVDGHVERISSQWIEAEALAVSANRVHPFWGAGK